MNLLEHYIDEIVSEEDCTDEYAAIIGRKPEYACIKATVIVDCYGVREKKTDYWLLPDWMKIKEQGFYLA